MWLSLELLLFDNNLHPIHALAACMHAANVDIRQLVLFIARLFGACSVYAHLGWKVTLKSQLLCRHGRQYNANGNIPDSTIDINAATTVAGQWVVCIKVTMHQASA